MPLQLHYNLLLTNIQIIKSRISRGGRIPPKRRIIIFPPQQVLIVVPKNILTGRTLISETFEPYEYDNITHIVIPKFGLGFCLEGFYVCCCTEYVVEIEELVGLLDCFDWELLLGEFLGIVIILNR